MEIKESRENKVDAGTAEMSTTVLGTLVGDVRYLVQMNEISEVVQVSEIVPVPLTHPWFLGIVCVHGNLYSITDLGAYLGGDVVPFDAKSRILLVSENYKINGGFIVNHLLGIRNMSEFEPEQQYDGQLRSGIAHVYRDKEGRPWYELDLRALVREKHFLQIAC